MNTQAFLIFCFLPLLAFSLPTKQAPIMTFTTFTAFSFPEEFFTCYTTRYSPGISDLRDAVASLQGNDRIHCIPAGGSTDVKIAELINVEGTGEEEEEMCFLIESAVQQLIARCGFDGRAGGELKLPVGDVVLRLGDGVEW
jgi:hypothetical protein